MISGLLPPRIAVPSEQDGVYSAPASGGGAVIAAPTMIDELEINLGLDDGSTVLSAGGTTTATVGGATCTLHGAANGTTQIDLGSSEYAVFGGVPSSGTNYLAMVWEIAALVNANTTGPAYDERRDFLEIELLAEIAGTAGANDVLSLGVLKPGAVVTGSDDFPYVGFRTSNGRTLYGGTNLGNVDASSTLLADRLNHRIGIRGCWYTWGDMRAAEATAFTGDFDDLSPVDNDGIDRIFAGFYTGILSPPASGLLRLAIAYRSPSPSTWEATAKTLRIRRYRSATYTPSQPEYVDPVPYDLDDATYTTSGDVDWSTSNDANGYLDVDYSGSGTVTWDSTNRNCLVLAKTTPISVPTDGRIRYLLELLAEYDEPTANGGGVGVGFVNNPSNPTIGVFYIAARDGSGTEVLEMNGEVTDQAVASAQTRLGGVKLRVLPNKSDGASWDGSIYNPSSGEVPSDATVSDRGGGISALGQGDNLYPALCFVADGNAFSVKVRGFARHDVKTHTIGGV